MKTNTVRIPSGKPQAVKPTFSPAEHMNISSMLTKLAAHHRAMAGANAPDAANPALPRPDKSAINSRGIGYQGRSPVIGSPNSAAPIY